jgi:hypothetical protein
LHHNFSYIFKYCVLAYNYNQPPNKFLCVLDSVVDYCMLTSDQSSIKCFLCSLMCYYSLIYIYIYIYIYMYICNNNKIVHVWIFTLYNTTMMKLYILITFKFLKSSKF